MNERELEKRIREFQQVKLAHLPTPLERLRTLSSKLKGPKIYIKRDDETGLAFGGNKARKLDFIIADALKKKSDVIITWAGVQSNWCRQTAAAARMYGIKPILVLFKRPELPSAYDGNLLLDFIMEADIRIVEPKVGETTRTEDIINKIVEEQIKKGHNPYVVPVGGSRVGGSMMEPLGAISYTAGFLEIYKEMKKAKAKLDAIVIATGSGGTQAGLVVGAKALGTDVKIVGISISGKKESIQENVSAIANITAEALGLKMTVSPEEVIVFDDYIGEGYGLLNQETADAIRLIAKTEGILLDPVYTGKAMVGLIALIKKGYFSKRGNVVFLHTGGTPALFVYRDRILELLKK
ncbi:MAG: D-cysteine desulfhydrase family protein [Candidatus Aminicenantes bacterium]|nr:MAG: D-cysteine desulfhydrase family protein [Candidatus Aminicenantes bacterium]